MKNQTIIAAFIIASAFLVSAGYVGSYLRAIDDDIRAKSMPSFSVSPKGVISVEIVGKVPTEIQGQVIVGNAYNQSSDKYVPFLVSTNQQR